MSSRRWVSVAVGAIAVVIGAALTLKPFSSLDALTLYIAGSLVAAGIGELLTRPADQAPWPERIMGGLLVCAGLLALALPGLTVRAVAVVVGVALLLGGGVRVAGAWRGSVDERVASGIGGLAGVIIGVLAFVWPDLTVLVVAVLVGPVAVVLGAGQIARAVRDRPRAAGGERRGRRRRGWHVLRATAALALALVLVAVSTVLHRGEATLDDFYDASAASTDKPGTLLDQRAFTRAIPDDAKAVRILYTTTGSDGRPEPASGLVVAPKRAPGPLPVILWAHGTTGVARKCAPSALAEPFTAGAMFVLAQIIQRGWALVAPDYPGLGTEGKHPYLVGVPEARSALDAVRAARRLDDFRLSEETVAWGHSQGGGAALWVGEEGRRYASDVPLAGVAALAPASDVLELARGLLTSPAGMLFASFVVKGYSDTYPDVRFNRYIRPAAQTGVREVVNRCLSETATLASLPTVSTGQSIFARDPTTGPLAARLRENIPNRATGIPTLVAQGLDDGLVLPGVQRRFVATLCAAGQAVDFRTYRGRDHVSVVAADSPLISDLLRWTTDRFAAMPATSACTTTQG